MILRFRGLRGGLGLVATPVLALALAACASCGSPPEPPPGPEAAQAGPDAPGRWRAAREPRELSAEEAERLSRLMSLPYSQGYRDAPAETDVTAHERDRVQPGINAYSSGHAPAALLIDMDGRELHRWSLDISEVWPDLAGTKNSAFWRRVRWLPGGDVLAIYEGSGMVRLDRDSRLRWAFRGGCHHDVMVTDDGRIHVLTRRAERLPRWNERDAILTDWIAVLDDEGRLLEEYSLLECFENSPFRSMLDGLRATGDIFHTNSLEVFDGRLARRSPLFRRGNVLVSIWTLDILAIVDPERRSVVWAASGRGGAGWHRQHDARLLDGGDILFFDNQGREGRSRVLELRPSAESVEWSYAGSTGHDLYSKSCGANQRLANGNTLITESDNGRALEVTRDGRVVWEFYNPHRAGESGEWIATLFEMQRLDASYADWLEAAPAP